MTVEEILEMLEEGMTQAEIGQVHGFASNTIHSFLSRRGYAENRFNPFRGKPLNLRKLRSENGLTQADVASGVELSQQAVSQHERGVKHPTVKNLKAYSEFYGVEFDKLFSESEVK